VPAVRVRFLAILLVLVSLQGCGGANDAIVGRWQGDVVLPAETTRMILDFSQTRTGLAGRMSLPDHRLLGKPLKSVRQDGAVLSFVIPARQGDLRFSGRIGAQSISGVATDANHSIPIQLRRAGATPPPPYDEEPIQFQSGGATLSGSLLMPRTPGPIAAVVLAHGSSTPDRNDFRYYADLFARSGIAAFIYDKRDTGPQTDGGRVSLETLAQDLRAASEMLRTRNRIDPRRVGLWGFSQGGWLAPMVAADHDYAFLVALSAPGVTYAEVNRFADRRRLQREGFPASDIEAADRALARVDQYARDRNNAAALQVLIDGARRRRWADRTTLPRAAPTDTELAGRLRWLDLDLDPVEFWRRVRAPVLLMYGEVDEAVPVQRSAERIEAALRAGGNPDVSVMIYPGANHELAPAPTLEQDMITWTIAHAR
jgi:dipeptidyl aminopeptidase/acylaminoacyl peptidase